MDVPNTHIPCQVMHLAMYTHNAIYTECMYLASYHIHTNHTNSHAATIILIGMNDGFKSMSYFSIC